VSGRGIQVSVILPAHNPDEGRLQRVLRALNAQTLAPDGWELVVIDSASTPALKPLGFESRCAPARMRVLRLETPGLGRARKAGMEAAAGEVLVLVDDDNVLQPDYLERAIALFSSNPRLGAAGGKSLPEFTEPPAQWTEEFFPLLALRDLGDKAQVSDAPTAHEAPSNAAEPHEPPEKGMSGDETRHETRFALCYPSFAPIGAGMALRAEAARDWAQRKDLEAIPDRRGTNLSSGGDNDIVLCLLAAGWEIGYFPSLVLTHLIPPQRLEAAYLGRLNRGIQESWMRVLTRHGANRWGPLSFAGARLRVARAWLRHKAWRGPAEWVRWQGAAGHFLGRVRSPQASSNAGRANAVVG